jgi:Cu-Zn family superoxide dismutase
VWEPLKEKILMRIRCYMYAVSVILITLACLTSGCDKVIEELVTPESVDRVAVATISDINASGISGIATFTAVAGGTHVVIEVQNTTHGLHAMHLHTGSSCADYGPHWHPMGVPAGTPGIPVVQATPDMPPIGRGEVGNILVGEDGTGILEFTTPFWSLGGDPNTDILGKLIMRNR